MRVHQQPAANMPPDAGFKVIRYALVFAGANYSQATENVVGLAVSGADQQLNFRAKKSTHNIVPEIPRINFSTKFLRRQPWRENDFSIGSSGPFARHPHPSPPP